MSDRTIAQTVDNVLLLKQRLENLFTDNPRVPPLLDHLDRALSDIEAFRDDQLAHHTVITVVGHKKAGKSSLCAALIKPEYLKEQLAGSAHVAAWIGPTAPPVFEDKLTHLKAREDELVDLGKSFNLVDVPAFDSRDEDARARARELMTLSSYIVLVGNWETGLETDAVARALGHANGAAILPVITDDKWHTRQSKEAEPELDHYHDRLSTALPGVRILSPLRIPRWSAAPEHEAVQWQQQAEQAIREGCRKLLASQEVTAAAKVQRRYRQLMAELRAPMAELLRPLKAPLYDKQQREQRIVAEAVTRFLGTDDQLRNGLKLRLMNTISRELPAWMFPLKPFAQLLCLSAGAWDRLSMAMAGSLPSLAGVLFQSNKNLKDTRQQKAGALREFEQYLATDLKAEIESRDEGFITLLKGAGIHADASWHYDHLEVAGKGAELEVKAEQVISDTVSGAFTRLRGLNALGILITLLWICLMAGPIVALYGHYLGASMQAFLSTEPVSWQQFPAPSFSMIHATFLITSLPILLLAGVLLSIYTRRSKLMAMARDLRRDWADVLKHHLFRATRVAEAAPTSQRAILEALMTEFVSDRTLRES